MMVHVHYRYSFRQMSPISQNYQQKTYKWQCLHHGIENALVSKTSNQRKQNVQEIPCSASLSCESVLYSCQTKQPPPSPSESCCFPARVASQWQPSQSNAVPLEYKYPTDVPTLHACTLLTHIASKWCCTPCLPTNDMPTNTTGTVYLSP